MARKSCFLVLFLLFCTFVAQSGPVEIARARKVAIGLLHTNGHYDKSKPAPVLTDVTSLTPFTEFYVFNVDGNKGFVLVSADDIARPILGYSVNNGFQTENIPAHVLAWLQGYEKEIRVAREQGIGASERIREEWRRMESNEHPQRDLVPVVEALTTTIWNQSPYYNNLCPYDSVAGENSVTGCVATAMGQLMKYWNHPATGTGSHSYTTDFGTISVDFGATAYDWENMPSYLSSLSTPVQINAVATLLYHCGVSVEMDYSADGSGASTIGANGVTCESALKNYFKFNPSLFGDYKFNYTDAIWKQMLISDLNAGRPLIYRGQGESGGHCFICDGYDSDTNFHFNFGWSGYYNAFYPLSAMNLTSSMDFNDYQGAIFGIVPNGVGLAPMNVAVSNALPTSATVSWSDPNAVAATDFTVAYGLAAVFDTANSGTYTAVNTTDLHYTLQGLSSYTQYKVAVRAHCGDTLSPWSVPVAFTTGASAQPLPLVADFEGGMPQYWQQEYVVGQVNWGFTVQGGINGNPSSALGGSYNARFSNSGYGNTTRLITPMLNMVGDELADYVATPVAKLVFGHAHIQWQGDQDELRIYYRSTPVDSWMLLASYTESHTWERDTLILPNISATYQVAFEATANYGYGVCLDDISIFLENTTGNYATAPYICSFSDTAESNAWVLLNGDETNKWYIGMGTASGFNDPYALYVSSDNGMSNYYNVNSPSMVFAYRDITLNAGQYAYSYDWTANGESGRDYLRLALVPESVPLAAGSLGDWGENTLPGGALALDGGNRLNDQYEWRSENDVVDVPAAGNYRIVAMWHNDDRYGYQPPAAIDNIVLQSNSCVLPTNLSAGDITHSSVLLTWTAGGSENRWSITLNGSTYFSDSARFRLTGLSPNTEYVAEVRSICGSEASLAPRRIAFRTECGAVVLPYQYGFEDAPMGAGSAMPDCWHRISSNNYPYVVTSNAHTGTRSICFHSSFTQYAVLPSVSAPIHTLQMTLWGRTAAANSTALIVGMMSDPNDASTFELVEVIDSLTTTYAQFNISFENYAGTGIYPALKVAAGNMNYIYIDDISLSACTYFVTPANAFVETFESNSSTRECWTQEYDNGTINWTFATGGHNNHPSGAHGGSLNAHFYCEAYGQHTTRLISPMLVTSSLPAVKFSFWHAQNVWSNDQDRLTVCYRTSSSAPWTQLENFSNNIASWTFHEYYFPSSDSLQVSFMGDARYGYGIVLDDIVIEEAPYCGEVTDLTAVVSDTASATVRLSWSGGLSSGGYFRIQYGEHGFDPASGGITVNGITSTTYSIPFLSINTTYDFYITTICNSQQQSDGVMASVFVPSMPVRNFPYTCSFADTAENNQWILANGTQSNKWYIGTATGNDATNPHSLYISNDNGASNYYANSASFVYAYRDMELASGVYDYNFEWRCSGESTYDYLRVALLPQDIAITAGSSTGWSTTAVPSGAIALDGGSRLNDQTSWQTDNRGSFTIQQDGLYRWVFYWRNDNAVQNQPPAAVDNIAIQRNDCGSVSDPVATASDTGTIQLSWSGGLSSSAYYSVEYGPAGFVRGSGVVIDNIHSSQVTINNLATNTTYDFYITLVCPSQIIDPTVSVSSRTLSIPLSLPYQTSFDNMHDNSLWVLLNENQTNKWTVGEATGEGDYHALYISNDNGTSNAYNTDNASYSFAYRTVELTADSFSYSYSWKNYGENNYDYLRVALVPASVVLAAGSASGFSTSSLPAGSIALDGGNQLTLQGGWQQRSGNINITQAGTYNLVFFWRNDGSLGSQPPAAVDNLVFCRNNCSMPSHLSVVRLDSTSVTVSWDNVEGGSWRVGYGDRYDTVQTSSATIAGLAPGTDYTVNVMAICGIGFSVPATLSVRTLCSPMSLPFSYGFEDATGSGASHTFNACWRYFSENSNVTTHPYPYNYSHTGSYSYFTNTTSSTGTYLVVPAVAHAADQLILSFWARRAQSGSSYFGNLEIGVVDNPYNFASFQRIDAIDVESTTWNEYVVYTDNYQGSGGFLCIRAPRRTSGYNDVYIDDITIDTLPDCTGPVELQAMVSDTSARLTWHGIGHNVRWGVEYGLRGFTPGSGTFAYSTDTVFAITGLQPATEYDAYVYTDCHHTTSEAVLVSFFTDCGRASVPYQENFDSYEASTSADIDPCWYKLYSYNSNTHYYPYPSTSRSQYTGSKALYFYSTSSNYSYAVLPEFAEDIQTLQMSLKLNRMLGSVQVGYVSDAGDISTFHSLRTLECAADYTWESFTVPFSSASGSNLRMAIVAQGSSTAVLVDDVEVDFIPPCNPPAGLTASNIGTSSATLSWTAVPGIGAYRIEIGLEGFSEGSGSVIDSVAGTSYVLTNLQPGYTYNMYVSSICSSGTGHSASVSTTFTTACGVTAVPYTENFDTYGTSQSSPISPCWHKGYGTSDSQYSYPYPTAANAQYPGSLSLYFYGSGSTAQNGTYSYAALPLFADSIQNLQLTFKVYRTTSSVVSVGVLTAQGSYSSFQPVAVITPATDGWETHTVQFDNVVGTDRYICIAARAGTQNNRFYIDDISVERIPECPAPASINIDSMSDSRVVLSWPAVAGIAEYEVEYGLVGYPVGFGTVIDHIVSTSVALSGLEPSTTYSVSVRAKCGTASRSAATSIVFTTPCVLQTVPYSYGFDDYTYIGGNQPINACWTQLTNSTSTVYPQVTTQSSYQGNASLMFMANGTTYSCAVLPMFADSVQNLALSFYARRQNSNATSLVVGVINDLNNYASFRPVRTVQLTQTQSWEQFSVNFDTVTGDQLWMAIAMPISTQSGTRYAYVDNIEVTYHQPYSVRLTVADSSRGTVQVSGDATADGRFWPGASVTLTAMPNEGYSFGHWTVGNSVNPYTFTMPSNDVCYNNIVFNKNQYSISVVSSNLVSGYTDGSGLYDYLDTATISATPYAGYYFAGWSDGNTDNPRSVVVTRDSSFTANFLWGCPDAFASDTVEACDIYAWTAADTTIITSGTYLHSYLNHNLCQIVDTLRVTIHHSQTGSETLSACDQFSWHGHSYTAAGTYVDTLATVHDCDSVVTLHLTLGHSNSGTDVQSACDSYTWHGTTYTASTSTPAYTATNAEGCDSVVTLHLTLGHSNSGTDVQSACDSYTWHGTTYTASTSTPTYTATNAEGCDSVVTLHLTLGHSNSGTDVQSACDSYTWHGTTYTASTSTPTYTSVNAEGCDSVATLHLTIYDSRQVDLPHEVCDEYVWHGRMLTQSGDYVDSSLTTHGCDSVTTLHLTVNYSFHAEWADTVCDSYTWPVDGQVYTVGGSYLYADTTRAGCDSSMVLDLVLNYSHQDALTDTACDSYSWHGTRYTHGGSYAFDSVTAEGCGYHETLVLVVNQSTHTAYNQQSCDGYYWHDQTYDTTGIYTYDYINAVGCPSTDTLHLTIDFHSDTAHYATACDSYNWNGSTYTESGVYTFAHGQFFGTCTNVDTLYLTIHRSALIPESLIICDSYNWNGIVYTESGIYYLDTVTAFGCDSTVQLTLDIKHSVSRIDTVEVCDGYLWEADSHYYYHSGTYTYHDTTFFGCDSNMTLLLTVHPSYGYFLDNVPDWVEVCDSIIWNGRVYTETGYYLDTLQTIFGCDSLAVLSLQVNRSYRRTDTIAECNSYTWIDGITYTASTAAPVIADSTIHGCDSVLSLDLTINYSTYDVFYQNYCDTFAWHDQTLTQSGTYIYDYVNDAGCSSSDTLHLTITTGADTAYHVSACDSYRWNDSLYTQSGVYLYDYSILGSTCTNVDTLYLTVNHSNSGIDSIVACDSYTWIDGNTYSQSTAGSLFTLTNSAGCDSVVTLVLTIGYNSSAAYYDTVTEGETYYWPVSGETYAEAGIYLFEHTDDTICFSTDTLYLAVRPLHDTVYFRVSAAVNDTSMGYVIIYPDTVVAEYQAVYVVAVAHEGHRFLHWQDGDTNIVRAVWVVSDTTMTASFEVNVGIASQESVSYAIWADRSAIHVQGDALAGRQVSVYDVTGRRFATLVSSDEHLAIPADQWPTGVYFVKVDNVSAQRVVLHR